MTIEFEQARHLAENIFREHYQGVYSEDLKTWSSNKYLEANNCWLFFRNENIKNIENIPFSDFIVVIGRNGKKIKNKDFGGDLGYC